MKKIFFCIAIMAILAINLSAGTMAKADFNGRWKLDVSRSEGVPQGMEQAMTVVQKNDVINIETTVKTPEGEQTVPDSYTLDGKEKDFTAQNGKGKRTSKWTADGSGFEVFEKADIDTPGGAAAIERTRKWALSPDGKTLTIEINLKTPQGEQRIKRLFVKQ
jgi:hypothetical protein